MARSLQFVSGPQQFQCDLEKVDRNKLYGWVDKKAFDKDGRECFFGSLSNDGMHIFGRSAFESGYLDLQGQWLDRSDLKAVDADNQELVKHESSFNDVIVLDQTVTVETYLMHVATSVYHLSANPEMLKLIQGQSEIFCFPFNYYASYSPASAFLIEKDNEIFMIVGQLCGFEFVEMQSVDSALLEDDSDEEDGDGDEIDFSMF